MATAEATTSHDEIRQWVEARGGRPARVKATGGGDDPGVLRIDFPGFSGEGTLEEIEWDEFFDWFDRNNLAILLSSEEGNRFNKIVSRPARSARKSSSRRAGSKSSSRRGVKSSSSKAASSAKKASSKKKASSSKTASSAKKASSSKKAASSKKATSSKKASSSPAKRSSAAKRSSTTRRLVASKTSSAKRSTAKRSSTTRRLVASKTSSAKRSTARSASKRTTDHDEIRRWVEARGGFPAHVKRTGGRRGSLGVLRIDYPGYSGRDTLERVEWEEWFKAFDRNKLAFLYQDKKDSRFSKLVNR